MWNTPEGIRVLSDMEWRVFACGLGLLTSLLEEMIDEGDEGEITEVRAFESMSHAQKLCTLAEVATALHDDSIPPPALFAYNEVAIHAVFEMLIGALQDEASLNEDMTLRSLVWQATDSEIKEELELTDPQSIDVVDWHAIIVGFEEMILWDGDYEMADLIVDLPPEKAEALKARFTIDSDYYTAIPAEPDTRKLREARRTLKQLLYRS
jgi:hypothetical protein